jgi:phosphonopyruvate decarboxylase
VDDLLEIAKTERRPVALMVRKDTFEPYQPTGQRAADFEMTREQAIEAVVAALGETDAIVSTTGKISRELYECRDRAGQGHQQEFLTVGSMGHASQIAMGIALAQPKRQVFCLDGDGAMLMHMGGAAIVGAAGLANFKHVILNNGVHDSVGGMATAGLQVSFTEIVKACGYTEAWRVERREDLAERVAQLRSQRGPAMLEVMVQRGARADLGRPKTSPIENKTAFTDFLSR